MAFCITFKKINQNMNHHMGLIIKSAQSRPSQSCIITLIKRESDSEDVMDIYARFNQKVTEMKSVIVILCPHVGVLIRNWIWAGEVLKLAYFHMCLSSFVLNSFGELPAASVMAVGGLGVFLFHSFAWERDPLSRYAIQSLKGKALNEDARMPKTVVLVRKPESKAFAMRGILVAYSAAVCYWLWIAKSS